MKLLEDRILKDGHIGADNVLKVDSFLNHQIDVNFVCELGKEFYRLFKDENITKILTIEASVPVSLLCGWLSFILQNCPKTLNSLRMGTALIR